MIRRASAEAPSRRIQPPKTPRGAHREHVAHLAEAERREPDAEPEADEETAAGERIEDQDDEGTAKEGTHETR
jgi:hypothetical protein